MPFLKINTKLRTRGRPRSPLLNAIAAEYITWPHERPYGLLKELAYSNGVHPQTLADTIKRIKNAARLEVTT